MADVEFVENPDGVKQLVHSDEMRALLDRYVTTMGGQANDTLTHSDGLDYQFAVDENAATLVGHVWAAGAYAKNSNAKYNTLVRVLGL